MEEYITDGQMTIDIKEYRQLVGDLAAEHEQAMAYFNRAVEAEKKLAKVEGLMEDFFAGGHADGKTE